MNKFKPMLAATWEDLDTIKYPKFASFKLDGIRCIFHPELGMVTRSLKSIPNKQLNEKFAHLVKFSKERNIILDGELYGYKLTFQEITRAVMTQDFKDEKTCKKLNKEFNNDIVAASVYVSTLLGEIKFHKFDNFSLGDEHVKYNMRVQWCNENNVIPVIQHVVWNKEDIEKRFKSALENGYEGLILRDPESPYKFGRSTLKEEYLLKVKPFKTFDAKIIGVQQSTEVDPSAEKKINELGRSVTSKKKDDRVLIDKASAFLVKYGEHKLKVSLAMTDPEKEEVWKNKDSYVGKMIEYRGMLIGSKDVPRHPTFVRFREDRD